MKVVVLTLDPKPGDKITVGRKTMKIERVGSMALIPLKGKLFEFADKAAVYCGVAYQGQHRDIPIRDLCNTFVEVGGIRAPVPLYMEIAAKDENDGPQEIAVFTPDLMDPLVDILDT